MSNNENYENYDPFRFAEDNSPSWYQQLYADLHEFVTNSFGFDASVWMGRVVVSLVIVLVWDAYWAPPPRQQRERNDTSNPKQQDPTPPIPQEPSQQLPKQQEEKDSTRRDERNEPAPKGDEEPENLPPSPQSSSPKVEERKPAAQSDPKGRASASGTASAPASTPAEVTEELDTNNGDDPQALPTATTVSSPLEANATATVSISNSNSTSKSGSDENAGLQGFHYWYEVETSLYRIYTLAHKDPSIPTIPPYAPNSKRGRVAIEMRVTNKTGREINVFWVDHKGKQVPKGKIARRSGVWTQTTWIDHPWVFEDALTSTPYLYYVPYKVIPSIPQFPTMGSDGRTGLYEFSLVEAAQDDPYHIGVIDQVLPLPQHLDQPLKAIHWTLQHLSRVSAASQAQSSDHFALETATLQKFLLNIMNNPGTFKYRNLRTSSKHFFPIWNSALRGLLLAVGFVENCGWCTLGWSEEPISSHKVQEIALLSYLLNEWSRKTNSGELDQEQPTGASDGFGRAGFGRAGAMG